MEPMAFDKKYTIPVSFPVYELPARVVGRSRDILSMGSVIQEEVIRLENWPEQGGQQSVPVTTIDDTAGGCTLTLACVAARLGSQAAVIGCTGDGKYAQLINKIIVLSGVEDTFLRRYPGHDGNLVILITNKTGDWATMDYLDPEIYLRPEDIPSLDQFNRTAIFHIDGYAYLDDRSMAPSVLAVERARQAGCLLSVDASAAAVRRHLDFLKKLYLEADIFFCNQDEALAVTGCASISGATQKFKNSPQKLVFLKMGTQGCFAIHDGKLGHAPAFPVTVVDTIGAGDSLAGCILHFLLKKNPLPFVTLYGNAAGALACLGSGSLSNRFTLDDINMLVNRHFKGFSDGQFNAE